VCVGVVHSAQIIAGSVKLWPQPDGFAELLHRLAHELRPLVIRRHGGQLLQHQAPIVQRLHWHNCLRHS